LGARGDDIATRAAFSAPGLQSVGNNADEPDMGISLNIPADLEKLLREALGTDLERKAIEALALEGYRTRRLGTADVRRLLGLETRMDAEAWLASKGATMNYSLEDLEEDRTSIGDLFGKN
jgi:hypothetical protein